MWDHEAHTPTPPRFTDEGFRAALKIFMAAWMERIWILQKAEGLTLEDRMFMVEKAGQDLRQLVKTYADIDTHNLYRDNGPV